MAPAVQNLLSPAELDYLHSSLALTPPVRPDARTPTQFRPLIAETDILPGTNGSARICFADGTEAIVGVKAEVEKTASSQHVSAFEDEDVAMGIGEAGASTVGQIQWVDMAIEVPGYRDDDQLPVFLAAMLREALVASGELANRLVISPGWHWHLYIDILLISPPLSYPVPLLSLTTHLALLSTRLPALKSQKDEDPFFDDDWAAATPLYPAKEPSRPPITLLVAAVGSNVLFDPSKEEIAVSDTLLAISLSQSSSTSKGSRSGEIRLLSIRTVDSPSRATTAGVPDVESNTAAATGIASKPSGTQSSGADVGEGLWKPPRGGMPRTLVPKVVEMCLAPGGVGEEVLAGLQAVEVG